MLKRELVKASELRPGMIAAIPSSPRHAGRDLIHDWTIKSVCVQKDGRLLVLTNTGFSYLKAPGDDFYIDADVVDPESVDVDAIRNEGRAACALEVVAAIDKMIDRFDDDAQVHGSNHAFEKAARCAAKADALRSLKTFHLPKV